MSLFQIKKKSLRTWEHIDSVLGLFILSKFYFSADGTKFQIVEQGQAKRRIYDITEIEVYDIGGGAETFVNITDLSLRLEELRYPAYNLGGVFEFNPADYDLDEFTNTSGDPFARQSDIPSTATDITANHFKDNYNISTNTPTLVNGTGQIGDEYLNSVAGSRDFGAGNISVRINDILHYNGSIWIVKVARLDSEVNFGSFINGLTSKTTPVDADSISLVDSADSNKQKKATFLQVWTNYFKAKSDLLYQAILTSANFGAFINSLTSKTLPVSADQFGIMDSAASNIQKKVSWTDLKTALNDELPSLVKKSWSVWQAPGTGGTAISVFNGTALTITGTAGAVTMALDTKINCIPFVKATGSSGAGQSCGWKETSTYNTSLIQGFEHCFIYGCDDNTAGSRGFVGLYGAVAAIPSLDPSTFTVYNVGLAHDAADTNLSIMHNDELGTSTKVALGASFPANDNTQAYLLFLNSQPVAASINAVINWTVVNIVSGATATGSITTNLPRNSTTGVSVLAHAFWRNTGANATVPIIKMSKSFLKRLT